MIVHHVNQRIIEHYSSQFCEVNCIYLNVTMADWENDDIPAIAKPKPIRKWDDEDVDEEDIKPNWEESSDEEKEKEKPATTPTAPSKKTTAQKLADAKRNNNYGSKEDDDELERKRKERKAVIDADMENTRGMFQGVSIKETEGSQISSKNLNNAAPIKEIKDSTLDSINPKTKDQFDEFSKLLVNRIQKHEKQGNYVNFINDFIRELCLPLRDADVRKVASTLTNLATEKQKEKDKDKPKKKGKAKPALQVERIDSIDITNYDEYDDFNNDFDDYDDFM